MCLAMPLSLLTYCSRLWGSLWSAREPLAHSVLPPRAVIARLISAPTRRLWIARRSRWFLLDGAAVLLLVAVTLLAIGSGLRHPGELAKGDAQALWLPLYSFMGERLRAFDLPGWNPHQFAGTPFAGDPNSGWGYLPAMVLFAMLAPATAVVALAIVHLALSGLTAYALARMLGVGIVGS